MPGTRSSGRRPHFLKLQRASGTPNPDGDGGFSGELETFADVFGSVEPATHQRLERFTLAGFIGAASHIVTIPFMPGIALQQVVLFGSRQLGIVGFADPEELHIDLVLVCQEIKP